MTKRISKALESTVIEAFEFGVRVRQVQKEIQDGINILSDHSHESPPEIKTEVISFKIRYNARVHNVVQVYEDKYKGIEAIEREIDALEQIHEILVGYMKHCRAR